MLIARGVGTRSDIGTRQWTRATPRGIGECGLPIVLLSVNSHVSHRIALSSGTALPTAIPATAITPARPTHALKCGRSVRAI